jgi:glycosyltransferase involved in cell wall biosynthesis
MLSIVTGTLNRKELLGSLIKNTVGCSSQLELVLVDGGSVDGTQEYIKDLCHPNISLIEVGRRSNYGHYMNLGIHAAKYEWVCQWNDDVLLENPWENVLEILKKDLDLYVFDWYNEAHPEYSNLYWNNNIPRGSYGHCLSFGVYKKQVFRDIGLYDEQYLYYGSDADMTERSIHFNKKISINQDIRVRELNVKKQAYGDLAASQVDSIIKSYYTEGKIPEWVSFLK